MQDFLIIEINAFRSGFQVSNRGLYKWRIGLSVPTRTYFLFLRSEFYKLYSNLIFVLLYFRYLLVYFKLNIYIYYVILYWLTMNRNGQVISSFRKTDLLKIQKFWVHFATLGKKVCSRLKFLKDKHVTKINITKI